MAQFFGDKRMGPISSAPRSRMSAAKNHEWRRRLIPQAARTFPPPKQTRPQCIFSTTLSQQAAEVVRVQ